MNQTPWVEETATEPESRHAKFKRMYREKSERFDAAMTKQLEECLWGTEGGDTFTWKNPEVFKQWKVDWKFSKDHTEWCSDEVQVDMLEPQSTPRGYAFGRAIWLVTWNHEARPAGYVFHVGSDKDAVAHVFDDIGIPESWQRDDKGELGFSTQFQLIESAEKGELVKAVPCG